MTRKYLLSIFEQSAEAAAKRRREIASGQSSLFAGFQEVSAVDMPLPESAKEELDKQVLLSYEKEMLGLYVSDNPLFELAKILEAQTTSIAAVREKKDGSIVTIGGLVGKINRITTRKGEGMAFVVIEGLEGSMEVVVFPAVLEKHRALVVEDAIIKIKGRIDVKEDEVKLIARDIAPLETKKTMKKQALYLKVVNDRLDKQLIAKLHQVLTAHPGDAEVYLHLHDGGDFTTLRRSRDFQVASSGPVIGELSGLLGDGSVTVS